MKFILKSLPLVGMVLFVFCGQGGGENVIRNHAEIDHVKGQLAKLAPVTVECDDSALTADQKTVLHKLVDAARVMDRIFLKQVYAQNPAILQELKSGDQPDYAVLKEYFTINFGPFDRLDQDRPFINTDKPKPLGANYYPADMTREEFETFISENPKMKEAFTSSFTIIRRNAKGELTAVPYSEAYAEELGEAARLLREAAEKAGNPTLKTYLMSRADAFENNDYYQSDMDWMDLEDHQIEIVIGPYEVYEDNLFGYKAAFEAFVTLVDAEESRKLQKLESLVLEMEKNLPIPEHHRNLTRGKSSPIVVVNEVFTGGDTKAGVQTLAFNLPNDERVREAKGSKKVMLKNILRAKFDKIWIPIAQVALKGEDFGQTSFDAYFNHVLMHEISHGLGPGKIVVDGRETSVNLELKDLYSTLEEAKADVLGIYNLQYLIDEGVFPGELESRIYPTYLGGMFRSIRFGIDAAHGGGNAIQLNYLLEKDAFVYHPETAKFSVNRENIKTAVKELAAKLLMIQARGDYPEAARMIDAYRKISPEIKTVLDKLKDIPVDIRPEYQVASE